MRRLLSIIVNSFVGLMVVGATATAGVLGYARSNGLLLLSVQTGSMRPAIRPGDAVLVLKGYGKLIPGDIISYRSLQNPAVTITHRITAINPRSGQLITKGDSLAVADPAFGPDRIIGKVRRVIPGIGFSLSMMRRPIGLIIAVYVPALILAYGELRRLMRHYVSQRYRLHAYPW